MKTEDTSFSNSKVGNNIVVYPASCVILTIGRIPRRDYARALCEILRCAQKDTIVAKKSILYYCQETLHSSVYKIHSPCKMFTLLLQRQTETRVINL